MTLIKDILVRNPADHPLPNDGVAKVNTPETDQEWKVLEWELSHFVDTGEYGKGLKSALSSFLQHLDQETQPAVWISGFYGSGKSHLARVLEYLWSNRELPSGSTPRGLVRVPPEVRDALAELDTIGKRRGGLWSAAGKVSGGTRDSFRLSMIAIVLRAAGLPEDYPAARLVIWLGRIGKRDAVEARLAELDTDLETELLDHIVSTKLRSTLLELIPDFASSAEEARKQLRAQYPQVSDITESQLLQTLEDVFDLVSDSEGKRPCVLIALDELQQFINDDAKVALVVQDAVEACSSKFGSSLLFVGTGQSALTANPVLARFQGRFTVGVPLSDTDVNDVVRQVVLRKKPEMEPQIQQTIDIVRGEIDRHLQGTEIGAVTSDGPDLVPDYPILPSRRRFWEKVLQAIDQGGGGGLRSQLRTTHEGVRRVVDEPLGAAIGAEFLYEDQEQPMIQSRTLLRGTATQIRALADGTSQGELDARICRAVFLIDQLPRQQGSDTGVRSTEEMLSDLLVTDLHDSGDLRHGVKARLDELSHEGGLLKHVDGEYLLQTPEDQEWDAQFERRAKELAGEPAFLASRRSEAVQGALANVVKLVSVVEGESKQKRDLDLHYGETRPAIDGKVPVWVRDGWQVSKATAKADAGSAGASGPVITVFIPKESSDELAAAIARVAAADEVISNRAAPTDEARDAARTIAARRDRATERRDQIVQDLLASATVIQDGGTSVAGTSLAAALQNGADASASRLFTQFKDGDHASWGTVLNRAREGNTAALDAVGYQGAAGAHPVCQAISHYVGAGKKGSDVIKNFTGPPYGWPRDAVQAGLMVLLANELVIATVEGVEQTVKQLSVPKIGPALFRVPAGRAATADEKLAVRSLCSVIGIKCESGDEAAKASELITALRVMATDAGGEPPLPASPAATELQGLDGLQGTERVTALAKRTDEIKSAVKVWQGQKELIAQRMPVWQKLERLLALTGDLDPKAAREGSDAVRGQRTLLVEPDPVQAVLPALETLTRDAVNALRGQLIEARAQARSQLEAQKEWDEVDATARAEVLNSAALGDPVTPDLGDLDRVIGSLQQIPISTWRAQIQGVPGALQQAALDLARRVAPETRPVALPSRTLEDDDDVARYIADVEKLIRAELRRGPIIVS